MEYANKGYLDTPKAFREKFVNPIQLYNDGDCAARFRKVTAPFMMRRMKTDKSIISDLPDKIELDDYAALTSEQAAPTARSKQPWRKSKGLIPPTTNPFSSVRDLSCK